MNKDAKQKWLEALRSERYKQGKGFLRLTGGYCCLGVLCDVMGAKWEDRNGNWFAFGYNQFIPSCINDKVGLSFNCQCVLAGMNDDGKTFHEIADYIEKNL